MSFGRRLRALREKQGWDVRELRERSGLAMTHIQYLEKDMIRPSGQTIESLASAFGISPDELREPKG